MSKPTQIKEPQQALANYLQELLLDEELDTLEQNVTETIETDPIVAEFEPDISESINSLPGQKGQALLFEVAGMQLALSLDELDGIETWPEEGLSQIPGYASYVVGTLSRPKQHTEVIDLTTLITNQSSNSEDNRYILLVNNKQLGLAVSAIRHVVKLEDENVRWRREPGQRPWLAGMLMSPLSSIISLTELLKILR
ncbi:MULTISPECIES: chemotaxis protein CheW [unclassified Methylophaga]|uniref:chemotaxis protein CheW n=1 Tax=unclassified Methylophaga TaxID=2629249 RepID=UPI0010A8102D|nr:MULTISPECIES: chemotaxis protein CheW [unclassified Methylophaga]MDO8825545.1 chemotaxis protein CheW [Methylophaga sp.]THK42434.1 chemotaxis protein CheW [Methylophaga sp. SB9B]